MMTPEMSLRLKESLLLHEGKSNFPYFDNSNPPQITIGIGYNLTARGLPNDWIDSQFNQDVDFFYNALLKEFPWYKKLNQDRQVVLIDMAFMGWKKFLQFENMFHYLSMGDFDNAAVEMLNSEWANQVKKRAIDLSNAMRNGVIDYV